MIFKNISAWTIRNKIDRKISFSLFDTEMWKKKKRKFVSLCRIIFFINHFATAFHSSSIKQSSTQNIWIKLGCLWCCVRSWRVKKNWKFLPDELYCWWMDGDGRWREKRGDNNKKSFVLCQFPAGGKLKVGGKERKISCLTVKFYSWKVLKPQKGYLKDSRFFLIFFLNYYVKFQFF